MALKRFTIIGLIFFFLAAIIYSLGGIIQTYLLDPKQFGNTIKEAFDSMGGDGGTFWLFILTVIYAISWLVYSFYLRKKKSSYSKLAFHSFIAFNILMALLTLSQLLNNQDYASKSFQSLYTAMQLFLFACVGVLLIFKRRAAMYIYMILIFTQFAFYNKLEPSFYRQIITGLLVIGSTVWLLLLKTHWKKLR